jgi:hypothetical protein
MKLTKEYSIILYMRSEKILHIHGMALLNFIYGESTQFYDIHTRIIFEQFFFS